MQEEHGTLFVNGMETPGSSVHFVRSQLQAFDEAQVRLLLHIIASYVQSMSLAFNERIIPHMRPVDTLVVEKPSLRPEQRPGRRPSRLVRTILSLAAVLLVGMVVAGFALLEHTRQSSQVGASTPENIIIAISRSGTIYGLSKDGQLLWSNDLHSYVHMVRQGDAVYASSAGALYKFDIRNGQTLWEEAMPKPAGIEVGSVDTLLVENDVIAVGSLGAFEVLNASNGSFLWGSGNKADLRIIAEHNHVLYTNNGPQAFQLTTGKHLWTATPSVDTVDMVFTDQAIYALGEEDGGNPSSSTVTVFNITTGQTIKTVHLKQGSSSTGDGSSADSSNVLYTTNLALQDCAIRHTL